MKKPKRVFLRADLNVPLVNGTIVDDYRLQMIKPTLDMLLEHNAHIILATHIGRPEGKQVPALSTKHLIPWFEQEGYTVSFAPTLEDAQKKSTKPTITLLENLRFYPGEQTENPEERAQFAHALRALADYYVNDAFGVLHRNDTSITDLALLFDEDHRSTGLLIEHECATLEALFEDPEDPFLLILGGGKPATKLPLLEALFDVVDVIALCPAVVFTLLAAQEKPVGLSLVEQEYAGWAREFLNAAHDAGKKILWPTDYVVAHKTLNGPLSTVSAEQFPVDGIGLSLGPNSVQALVQEILRARTVVMNGLPGIEQRPETIEPLRPVFAALAQTTAYTIIGGGQTTAAAQRFGVRQDIDHVSTGGGSLLAFLSGEEMPGLAPFTHE